MLGGHYGGREWGRGGQKGSWEGSEMDSGLLVSYFIGVVASKGLKITALDVITPVRTEHREGRKEWSDSCSCLVSGEWFHVTSVHIGLVAGSSRLRIKGTLNPPLLPLATLIQGASRGFMVGLDLGMPPQVSGGRGQPFSVPISRIKTKWTGIQSVGLHYLGRCRPKVQT